MTLAAAAKVSILIAEVGIRAKGIFLHANFYILGLVSIKHIHLGLAAYFNPFSFKLGAYYGYLKVKVKISWSGIKITKTMVRKDLGP